MGALGQAAIDFGRQNLGKSVTMSVTPDGKNLQVVIYDRGAIPPDGAFFPACANFVWADFLTIGAKTTADYGLVDPPNSPPNTPSPTDYRWGDPVLTFRPGIDAVSSLIVVQPGDVFQYRNVTSDNEQHTALVAATLMNGQFQILQQNFNFQTWVTLDLEDFNPYTQGTVWVWRPVAKPV
jgi:hypothetical protein